VVNEGEGDGKLGAGGDREVGAAHRRHEVEGGAAPPR
jgi:hypothetical protein